ncbi:MAG: biotin/lipoyl-containing protein [Fastidiosipilaceae bacterium]|jgi:biotin carboxyl carrier protein|nr:acetyl-CoA carboxylase biotin carboxyl carrier protein subunit [Clostridiaceae bacterium]
MKTYKVTVNDKEYIVKLEEVDANTAVEQPETAAVSANQTSQHAAPVASGNGEVVEAPLQGAILKLFIQPGTEIKMGETVLIIEAMKLENEVVAPRDGVVQEVFVKEGQMVDAEDALYSLV